MHKRIDRAYGDGFDVSGTLPYSPQFLNAAVDRFYAISVTDYSGAATGDSSGGFLSRSDEFYVTELLTKLWGKHQVKAGGEFRRYLDESGNAFGGMSLGAFTFNRNITSSTPTAANPASAAGGNAFASFLLGIRRSTRRTSMPAAPRPPTTHRRRIGAATTTAASSRTTGGSPATGRSISGCAGTMKRRSPNGRT